MFNSRMKNKEMKKEFNDAGYATYSLPVDKALFFMGCGFKPFNSAYKSDIDNLEKFIDALNENDPFFAHACVWYLGSQLGMRLGPSIATAELFYSFRNYKKIEKIVSEVFTRPDFFAHALGYLKYKYNLKSISEIDGRFLGILKNKFQELPAHTLKQRKMRRRSIKTKDLIKVLRPFPKNNEMSKLYKSIIEDGPESKLKVEKDENDKIVRSDHLTATIGDDSLDESDKINYISKNINRISVNSLLRNLKYLNRDDSSKLENKLSSTLNSINGKRVINPFDLIILKEKSNTKNESKNIDGKILNALDNILESFYNFDFKVKNPIIMFDNSGSMYFNGEYSAKLATKYMTLLKSFFEKDGFRMFLFHNYPWEVTEKVLDLEGLNHNQFAQEFYNIILKESRGGTSILDSMEKILKDSPDADSLVIITDEQTWDEKENIDNYCKILRNHNLNGKSIIINTDPVGKNTVFEPNEDIFRIGGREGKIIDSLNAIYNWEEFKSNIIEEFLSI